MGFHCGGFPCCRAWALGLQGPCSVVVMHRLSCSAACGIFLDQGSSWVSCIGRQILYHWTTREASTKPLLTLNIMKGWSVIIKSQCSFYTLISALRNSAYQSSPLVLKLHSAETGEKLLERCYFLLLHKQIQCEVPGRSIKKPREWWTPLLGLESCLRVVKPPVLVNIQQFSPGSDLQQFGFKMQFL